MSELVPMRYRIIADLPGYLRVRYGARAFSDEEGYGIAEELRRASGVTEVRTATANGSVLVRYDERDAGCRDRVLATLGSFQRNRLPKAAPSDNQAKYEADTKFIGDLSIKVAAYALRRVVLPAPLRAAWTVARSLRFIRAGLHHLIGKKELTVEVLDATAIAAAIFQGMYSSAGSVMLLLDISELLEEYTHARSRVALEQSLALNIQSVWLVSEDADIQVSLDDVRAGDRVRVRAGSMIPVDGEVIEGEAAVNESSMTGESRLVVKSAGKSVFAGTVVDDGSIVVEARQVGGQTRIENIVRMVEDSERLKAGVQSKAEHLADAIVPFSFLAFLAVLAFTRNTTKALSVLMVDYSCAIKLSTPVAVMSALREAAERGIVVKGGRYLETMAEADTIVFDKTGTLTTAHPAVESVMSFGDKSESDILRLAACLEEHFPHSMARAVVDEARRRGLVHENEPHAEVKYLVAHGISSNIDGKEVVLGSPHYVFEDEGVPATPDCERRIAAEAPGCSVIYLAIDGKLEGAIAIADPVREEAAAAIAGLRDAGFTEIIMLTGDGRDAAEATARKLGIDEFRSQVLPEDKAQIVAEYQAQGRTVVMIGDGINDSPALATADCSVAMLDASDIAREVADVTLLDSSLDEILTLRRLSSALMRRIERNYRFIVAFNTALLACGVAGMLQPTASALLHNGSTAITTACNMRRLLQKSEKEAHREKA